MNSATTTETKTAKEGKNMNITANEIIKRRIELSALSDSDREWMLKGAEYFSFAAQYTVEWTSDDIGFWELFMASIREYTASSAPVAAPVAIHPTKSRCQIWDGNEPSYI